MRPKPTIHMCSLRCKIRCLLGNCYREHPEDRCRCCQRFDKNTAHAASRGPRSEVLETPWWQDTPVPPTEREKSLLRRTRGLLEQLGQLGKGGVSKA